MRFIYTTDLHGSVDKYNRILEIARRVSANAVINGGDMLPKGADLFSGQRTFIADFLDRHFEQYDKSGIDYLCMLGNDDLAIHDEHFGSVVAKHHRAKDLAQNLIKIGDYELIGMNRVADYPFRLKDRCRMDTLDFKFPQQFGTGLLSEPGGQFRELPDWKRYVRDLPTIEDELELLPRPHDFRKSLYVIHMPPSGLGLDVCADRREVGSVAVRRFIEARQPLLALHGHIHESPEMSGTWKTNIGKTICIQPGQRSDLVYVLVDLDTMSIERQIVR